jgi:lysophospholipase L1-like esterase
MPRYPYRDVGTSLGRDFRNNLNANFDDIEADLRDIQIDLDAKESRITQIENDSIERDNDLNARINNLVLSSGDSSPEVADARYDSRTNTTYTTLKDRLDAHSNEIGILSNEIGDLNTLNTTDKSSLVNAINENVAQLAEKATRDELTNGLAQKADKSYVDTQISNIGDASPKGVFATLTDLQTAYPSGTTGIYVVSANGHWYYWNGSAWTDGGVYQSTGIAPKSITADKMGTRYRYASFIKGGVKVDTTAKTIEILSNTIISVNGTYYILNAGTIAYSDPNNRIQFVYYDLKDSTIKVYETGTAPSDGDLVLLFSIYDGKIHDCFSLHSITVNAKPAGGWDNFPSDKLSAGGVLFASSININTSLKRLELGAGTKNIIVKNKIYSLSSSAINVDLGTSISGWLFYNTADGTFYKATYVSELQNVTSDHVLIGVFGSSVFHLNCTGFTVDGSPYIYGQVENSQPWVGKKMNALGDSITYGAGGTVPYTDVVKNILGLNTVRNYGVSGSAIATRSGRTDSFVERYSSMDNDADIIYVMGGTNDFWTNVPLGTINDTTSNTFYGALKILCEGLINKYPNAFIFFGTPPKGWRSSGYYNEGPNANGNTMEDFNKAVKEVCGLYTIPVLDVKHELGIDPSVPIHFSTYTSDGIHYNNAGYERMGKLIARFIESKFNA